MQDNADGNDEDEANHSDDDDDDVENQFGQNEESCVPQNIIDEINHSQ